MSGGREELPFRIFRKAAKAGLRVAKEAGEATIRVAKTVPKVISEKGEGGAPEGPRPPGPGAAVPFRKKRSTGTRLHRSPLEDRPAGVMEYQELPRVRLEDVAGASQAVRGLREALAAYSGRVLIAGPPGVGKAVLALAYAAGLGKNIIDVDAGSRDVHEDQGALLREALEYARENDYTVVIYNLEGLVAREYAGKIIIYDPYTDTGGQGRIIIYDPYTDQEPSRIIIYDPYTRSSPGTPLTALVEEAIDSGVRVVATATAPTILPGTLRGRFQARITMGLPSYSDRIEILEAALSGAGLDGVTIEEIAAYTSGASASDLIQLARRLASTGTVTRGALQEALREKPLTGEAIARALYGVR